MKHRHNTVLFVFLCLAVLLGTVSYINADPCWDLGPKCGHSGCQYDETFKHFHEFDWRISPDVCFYRGDETECNTGSYESCATGYFWIDDPTCFEGCHDGTVTVQMPSIEYWNSDMCP